MDEKLDKVKNNLETTREERDRIEKTLEDELNKMKEDNRNKQKQ